MKRMFMIFIMLFLLISLSNCLTITIKTPDRCNPKKSVTEEQVRKDLEENKQEYLDMINLLNNKDLQITYITYGESTIIYVSIYTGSHEDFMNGILKEEYHHMYIIEELNDLSQEDKDLIKNFIENRNSTEVEIINKAESDGKIYFYFFGLTYIIYKDDEFEILTRGCPY